MMRDSGKVDFYLVKYEDLVTHPQETIDRIFNFIGIDAVSVDINEKIPRQNMLGHKKHFSLINSPDFNQMSLEKLTPEQKHIILTQAKEMLDHFGYI
jgi:hypothetical protein